MRNNYRKSIPLDRRSLALRKLILSAYTSARRGHLGSYLSLVEILRVLYDSVLRYDPRKPDWPGRDRFILSKGHGSVALYAILADKGFFSPELLPTFVKFDSMFGQHPDSRKVPGVEACTGSLGHGLSVGVGMALSARIDKQKHRVFVVISDAESQEGSVWEAALSIAKHNLTNLVVIVDYNHMQSYGRTREVLDLEPLAAKWKSFGFGVEQVNGHDVKKLRQSFLKAVNKPSRPQVVICHTVKGKGIAGIENNVSWHHKTKLSDEDVEMLYANLRQRGSEN
ncbi:transketolase [Candidatus Gottesmanbacteria bacterium RBG_16_52_11]|uniref:Transketolase n=1 Tax=Candidatus Gottesmanbacteria bacterium RBG_16_52_11 TaxID=1798374 RepID=A0A1F5YVT6_9BACT|nr:MAG: transketolase [Candidatus Gottesmanbacteria bacterium RBG_16_52_11]